MEKRQQFSFVWGFSGGDTVTLQSCSPTSIFVDRDPENGTAAQPVPPYTVIAYPEQGLPTVDVIGSAAAQTAMPWTPRFAAGTKVLISVVDALGNSGGVAQRTYTVGAGTSTACIPASSTSGVQMSIDAANTLQTCDTVPIRIQGGSTPYHLTIAVTNASSSVNQTMSGSNDYYQWINRAAPGQSLIIAVSDSNGQYATTSKFFTTAGATDSSCPGKSDSQSVFSGGNSSSDRTPSTSSATSSASVTDVPATTQKSKSLTGPIIGTIIALLVVFGAIAFWFFRKKRGRSYDDGPINSSTGFGMKDYKRGENIPGNESFVPLHDSASPIASATPLYGDQSHTANGSYSSRSGPRPVSGFDYYSSPPSNYSGTVDSGGPSRMGTITTSLYPSAASRAGLGAGVAAAGVGAAAATAGHQSKRQMMLEEQQRQQRWPGQAYAPPAPESVYPPQSNYSANPNPFADPHPYRPTGPSVIVSEAPPASTTYGYAGQAAAAPPPSTYKASHQSGSSGSSSQDTTMTPAARAKAAEAARERVPSTVYDDDDDEPIPYMQRQRPILGVTNPDRASTATSNSGIDPYGGIDRSRPTTQVYQHEDAGAVVELPPAYREFPGAGGAGAGGATPRPQ